MPSLTLVDAQDLARWANSRRAQEQLPALVRRLIHATTTTATHIELPAGDAIQQGGYDGVVVVNGAQHYAVPDGVSIWEFGVSATPKSKADEDYEKRKARHLDSAVGPVDPATTTFVFVTPRRWNAKTKWLNTRRREAFWRDVRVFDADDLEAWLEQAPATHIWLSTLLGHRPVGADDLEAVWLDWSESTTPPLSPNLILAGREACRDEIRNWFTSTSVPHTLGVEAESPDETIAFVAAALVSLPENESLTVLARTVVVRDAEALVQIAASDKPLRIVTTFSPGDLVQRATRCGHKVLIPRSAGEGVTGTIKVPRLRRDAAERELKAMGLPDDRAHDLAGVARRSLLALRRRLAVSASVNQPAWATPSVGPSALPIFFLGAVNDSVPGDTEALSLLAAEPAESAITRLTSLAAETDPPIRRAGSVWYLVSKLDAWEALSRFVSRDALERFLPIAVEVLGSVDPAYELPADQRWIAGLYKKDRSYSMFLLRGIADTLALLGSRGGSQIIAPGVSVADYASAAVRQLFEHAGRHWQRWASLAPVFPSLIEAAPDIMLSAIEAGLAGPDPSPVLGLFGHDIDPMFNSSPHTYLLWALERAAWSPDYLGRVALILAELDRRDPGGRLANRPGACLRSIFLLWTPETSSSVETRLSVIDMMRQHESEAAWKLMMAVLPKTHDYSMCTSRPDWREWAPESEVLVTNHLLAEHSIEIVRRMLEDAGISGARWADLVDSLGEVPFTAHQSILAGLSALAQEPLSRETRFVIWNALREFVSNHRSFENAGWALPPEQVNVIASALVQFEPDDLVARHRYLFSHHPSLPEGREQDFDVYHRLLAARRMEAAQAWYKELGVGEIVNLSATLERADALGEALAEGGVIPSSKEPELLRLALGHPEFAARALGRAYLLHRFASDRGTIPLFLKEHGSEWPVTTRAEALLAMPPGTDAWAEAEALGDEGCGHYWHSIFVYEIDSDNLSRALRELVRHERPYAAVDLAALYIRRDPKPIADDVLHVLLAAAPIVCDVTGYQGQRYNVTDLISFLEQEVEDGRVAEDDVVRVEILFLHLLRHNRSPKLLHKAMERDPSLFVEAVCLAYPAEDEVERELDDHSRGRARLALELLDSWHTPPSLENGKINAESLDAWIDETRRLLAKNNHADIGDRLIGHVLSGSPLGADGIWPAEPVRGIIERLKSDDFENGLHLGRFNQRGVVSRDPLSGGEMERGIKAQYEADAMKLSARWPRTAAFLRAFASAYERDAAHEDIEAELCHDLDE